MHSINATTIGKLIEAHKSGDDTKFYAYAEHIAKAYEDSGNDRASRIIRNAIDGTKGEPIVTMDSKKKKSKRLVHTNILDKDNIGANILCNLSSQLSDGYYEGEEDFYEEYWKFLWFTTSEDDTLLIEIDTVHWKNDKNIFDDMEDEEIILYVVNVLEHCYDDVGLSLFKDARNDNDVISLIKNLRLEALSTR